MALYRRCARWRGRSDCPLGKAIVANGLERRGPEGLILQLAIGWQETDCSKRSGPNSRRACCLRADGDAISHESRARLLSNSIPYVIAN
jgi:hypothetical protein